MEPESPTYDTARYGDVPVVDAVATFDEASGEVLLFAVNRSIADPVTVSVDVRAVGRVQVGDLYERVRRRRARRGQAWGEPRRAH
jgi:alpha-L-arabinofuranosidase